jgi:hypothetical protein
MAGFIGKWKMESSDNFDNYMKAVGVGAVMAKIGSTAKPTVIISCDEGKWNIRTETTFKSSDCFFKMNEEFEETTTDGRKCQTTFTLDGDTKLVQDQKGTIPSTITRELTDTNTLTVTCKAHDVVAVRVYKRA